MHFIFVVNYLIFNADDLIFIQFFNVSHPWRGMPKSEKATLVVFQAVGVPVFDGRVALHTDLGENYSRTQAKSEPSS